MANEIIQTLGFDASSAITNIDLLNNSLSRLSTNLTTTANAARTFNRQRLGGKVDKLSSGFDNLGRKGGAATQNLTNNVRRLGQAAKSTHQDTTSLVVSFATLSRVVGVQLLIRSLNQLQAALQNSIQGAVDLGQRVAEIATIAGGSLGSIDRITEDLHELSDAFGFDVLDLAEARYQELSNQVEGSRQNIEFFTASMKLARATNTSVADSVNLLSSVLNSFEQDASQSEEVAGVLFRTIEQGRVRANELASSLGTVTPLANNLGIEFNEVAAALAVITRQGTRANVALTQIRSLFNKLLKPSEALQEVFNQIGVPDAVTGIQRFGGVVPFLERIRQETEGNVAVQAELFNNVRGLAGLLNLFAKNGQSVTAVLQELGLTGKEATEVLDEAFQTVDDTEAIRFQKAVSRLNSTLTRLGEDALPTVNFSIETFVDGLNQLTANFSTFIVSVTGGVGAFVAYRGAVVLAANGHLFFARTLAAAVPLLAAFSVGALGARAALNSIDRAINENDAARLSNVLEVVKDNTKELTDQTEELTIEYEKLEAGVREVTNALEDNNREQFEAIRGLNTNFVNSIESSLQGVLSTNKRFLKELESAVEGSEKRIQSIQEERRNIISQREKEQFEASIAGFNDLAKAARLAQEAQRLRFDALDTTDLEERERLLERSAELAQQSLTTAEGTGNLAAIGKAQREVEISLQNQIELQDALEEQENRRREAAERVLEQERTRAKNIQDIVKQLTQTVSIFDGSRLKSESERQKDLQESQRLIDQLQSEALTGDTISVAEILDISSLAQDFQNQLQQVSVSFGTRREELQQQLDSISTGLSVQVPLELLGAARGLGLIDEVDPLNPFQAQRESAAALTEELAEQEAAAKRIASLQEQIQLLTGSLFPRLTSGFEGEIIGGEQDIANVQTGFLELSKEIQSGGILLQSEIDNFLQSLETVSPREGGLLGNIFGVGQDKFIENFRRQLELIRDQQRELFEEQEQFDPERLENLRTLQEGFEAFGEAAENAGLLRDRVNESNTAQVTMIQSVKLTDQEAANLAQRYRDDVTASINRAVAAQRTLNAEIAAGSAGNRMFGGVAPRMFGGNMQFLQSGGFARGTDNILAALSPREFVMNQRSSNQFAAQLTAMNAGITPAFRQEGGPVTNNFNVGDINVTGNEDPQATARSIMASLRREFRRGTSSRFN